jgi:hypothetical protein
MPSRPNGWSVDASKPQAAQENSEVESPVFPSNSIPKALIRERFAIPTSLVE